MHDAVFVNVIIQSDPWWSSCSKVTYVSNTKLLLTMLPPVTFKQLKFRHNGHIWISFAVTFMTKTTCAMELQRTLRTSQINIAKKLRHLCNVYDVILNIWWPLGSDHPWTPMWPPTEHWLLTIRLPVGLLVIVQFNMKSTVILSRNKMAIIKSLLYDAVNIKGKCIYLILHKNST